MRYLIVITVLLGIGYSQCNESNWQEYYNSEGHNMEGCDLSGQTLGGQTYVILLVLVILRLVVVSVNSLKESQITTGMDMMMYPMKQVLQVVTQILMV